MVAADLRAERVDQTPGGVGRSRRAVEDETVARLDGEGIGVGLVGRIERPAHRHLGVDRDRRVQIDQPERVGAGGVHHAVDLERVVAGRQFEHRSRVIGVRLRESALADQIAARSAQTPGEVVGVGERIERHPGVTGKRKAVSVRLARDVDRAVDPGDRNAGRSVEQDARFQRFPGQTVATRRLSRHARLAQRRREEAPEPLQSTLVARAWLARRKP